MTQRPGAHSPLLYDYLRRYQEDPTSRIFAPLAEAYRKAGLIDEAIEIAQEGLRVHPSFTGGRVALARALFDKKQYEAVIRELSPVIQDAPDNLIAQRLLAESCLILGRVAEALGAYKMLLYYSPQDAETAKMVRELENQAYEKGALVLRTDPIPGPAARTPLRQPVRQPMQQPEDPFAEFSVRSVRGVFDESPESKRAIFVRKVEVLQNLLQRVEKYRTRAALPKP